MCLWNYKYILFWSSGFPINREDFFSKILKTYICSIPSFGDYKLMFGVCVLFQMSPNHVFSFTCWTNCISALLKRVSRVSKEAVSNKGLLTSLSQSHSWGFWLLLLQVCVTLDLLPSTMEVNDIQRISTCVRKQIIFIYS